MKQSLRRRRAVAGLLFISPFILGFLLLFLLPLINSLQFSFSRIDSVIGSIQLQGVGLSNYKVALLQDPDFTKNIIDSLTNLVFFLPMTIVFSFFAASLLNRAFPGKGAARIIFFLPVILTSGVLFSIDSGNVLLDAARGAFESISQNADTGTLNTFFLQEMLLDSALPESFVGYIVYAVDNLYSVIVASGVQILIFLAALQSIPPSLYEASKIEGATGWECFWKITFPMVSPFILVNTIYTVIDTFTRSDNKVISQIQTVSINQFEYGLGSAMSWIYFLVIALILGLITAVLSRFIFYHDR